MLEGMADWSDRGKSTLLENRQLRSRPLTRINQSRQFCANEMNRRRWKQPPIASIEHSAPRASIKMAKRLIPLLDRVLVEKIVAPTKSVGGILLPESAVSKVRVATRDDSDASTPFPTTEVPPSRPPTDPYSLPR